MGGGATAAVEPGRWLSGVDAVVVGARSDEAEGDGRRCGAYADGVKEVESGVPSTVGAVGGVIVGE